MLRRKAEWIMIRVREAAVLVGLLAAVSVAVVDAGDDATCPHKAASGSPYAQEQAREIKALSSDEVTGLLAGEGLGRARAAELNHYPGPKHVLDLASQLDLTEDQIRRSKAIYDEMHAEAVRLGRELVDRERALDAAFGAARIDEEHLNKLLAEIAQTESRLRFVHLRAHLLERELLTQQQTARYDELRGYSAGAGEHVRHPGH